jgi:exopolyphosphatase/guanosine-5'-triphosphate,3'-diphosphate pyrophosphatase
MRPVRRACVDIGSNTTRLLVAECEGERLHEIHQERAFTRIGRAMSADGLIDPVKIEEVAGIVAAQVSGARAMGCGELHAVATAAVRRAGNREELVGAVREACGVTVRVLSGDEEARLAFLGASGTLEHVPSGTLGVVDVGGGSSELVVGTCADGVSWCESFEVGSGDLADTMLAGEQPSADAIGRARAHVAEVLASLDAPRPAEAVAVGGSATSLRRLAGPLLDDRAFRRAFELIMGESTMSIARRFALDRERVRLLPAALVILEAASRVFGVPLQVARGGLREGVLLQAAGLGWPA